VLGEVDGPDPAPLGLGDERRVGLPSAGLRVVEQHRPCCSRRRGAGGRRCAQALRIDRERVTGQPRRGDREQRRDDEQQHAVLADEERDRGADGYDERDRRDHTEHAVATQHVPRGNDGDDEAHEREHEVVPLGPEHRDRRGHRGDRRDERPEGGQSAGVHALHSAACRAGPGRAISPILRRGGRVACGTDRCRARPQRGAPRAGRSRRRAHPRSRGCGRPRRWWRGGGRSPTTCVR